MTEEYIKGLISKAKTIEALASQVTIPNPLNDELHLLLGYIYALKKVK